MKVVATTPSSFPKSPTRKGDEMTKHKKAPSTFILMLVKGTHRCVAQSYVTASKSADCERRPAIWVNGKPMCRQHAAYIALDEALLRDKGA
jgi:hypothetical protein